MLRLINAWFGDLGPVSKHASEQLHLAVHNSNFQEIHYVFVTDKESLNQSREFEIINPSPTTVTIELVLLEDLLQDLIREKNEETMSNNLGLMFHFLRHVPTAHPNFSAASDIARILSVARFGGLYLDIDRQDWTGVEKQKDRNNILTQALAIDPQTLLLAGMNAYKSMLYGVAPNPENKQVFSFYEEGFNSTATKRTFETLTALCQHPLKQGQDVHVIGQSVSDPNRYLSINCDVLGLSATTGNHWHVLGFEILKLAHKSCLEHFLSDDQGFVELNNGQRVKPYSIIRDPYGQYRAGAHLAGPHFYSWLVNEWRQKRLLPSTQNQLKKVMLCMPDQFPRAQAANLSDHQALIGFPFDSDTNQKQAEALNVKNTPLYEWEQSQKKKVFKYGWVNYKARPTEKDFATLQKVIDDLRID